MTKHDINQLQTVKSFPSISIIIPTHEAMPGVLENPIAVKNAIKSVIQALKEKVPGHVASPLAHSLRSLENYIDYTKPSKAIALFVNNDTAKLLYLPFSLSETVVIDDHFALKDIIRSYATTISYWILALSKGSTRLLYYSNDFLYEIIEPPLDSEGNPVSGFPLNDLGPNEQKYLAIGTGDLDAKYKDNYEIQFFRFIDNNFARFFNQEPAPLILLGVAEDIAYFKIATHHKDAIIEEIHGNFDTANLTQIKDALQPAINRQRQKRVTHALEQLEKATGALKHASGVEPVWHMANQGRIHLLLVEDNLNVPAIINPKNPDQISTHLVPGAEKDAENIIDRIIEMVYPKGGEVIIVDPETLKEHNHIAAILRY